MQRRGAAILGSLLTVGAPALAGASELRIVETPGASVPTRNADVCVVFDRPMEDGGREPSATLEFEPPVADRARWLGESLCIVPDLRPATRYRVRLVGDVVALDGSRLVRAAPRRWTLETPRPVFELHNRGTTFHAPRDQGVEVWLDDEFTVGREALRQHVRAYARPVGELGDLLDEDDRPIAERLAAARAGVRLPVDVIADPTRERGFLIVPRGGWPDDARITVVLEAGARVQDGPLPSQAPAIEEFETAPVQRIVGESCVDRSACPVGPLVISTRIPLDDDALAAITVTPAPERLEIADRRAGLTITGAFLAGETYTVTIPGTRAPIVRRYTFTRRPSLDLSDRFALLDPRRPRIIGVTTRRLATIAVRAARLDDRRVADLLPLARRGAALPWPDDLAADWHEFTVTPRGVNQWADTPIDLASLLGDQRGAFLVEARAVATTDGKPDLPAPARGLVQITGLSPLPTLDPLRSALLLVRLADGSPVRGASLEHRAGDRTRALGLTDDRGFVELTDLRAEACLPDTNCQPGLTGIPGILTIADPATADRVHVALPAFTVEPGEPAGPAGLRSGERTLGALLLTRGLVRPGETVKVVGWAAVDTPYIAGGTRHLAPGTFIDITVFDRWQIAAARAQVQADGRFNAALTIPAGAESAEYSVTAHGPGGWPFAERRLRVADVPAPKLRLQVDPLAPEVFGTTRAGFRVTLTDAGGQPVPIPSLGIDVLCREIAGRPPGVPQRWQIGPAKLFSWEAHRPIKRVSWVAPHIAVFELDHERRDGPRRCSASVFAERIVAGHTTYTIHPSAYLGVAVPDAPRAGERATIAVRAFTPTGVRTGADDVTVRVTHRRPGEYPDSDTPGRVVCELELRSTGADATCPLGLLAPGHYLVTAYRRDFSTRATFEVATPPVAPTATDPSERLEIVTHGWAAHDETLQVRLRAPWRTGAGLLSVRHGGLAEAHPFTLRDGEAIVALHVKDAWAPGVALHAAALRPATATALPAIERDSAWIDVDTRQRRLAVDVEPAGVARPGGPLRIRVRVRDASGRPVAARVTLWTIDEAELHYSYHELSGLTDDLLPLVRQSAADLDPLVALRRPFVARDLDVVVPVEPPSETWYGRGGGGGIGYRWHPGTRPRAPIVVGPPPVIGAELDARGECELVLDMPAEPATFRVFAVASAPLANGHSPGRLGLAETSVRVAPP